MKGPSKSDVEQSEKIIRKNPSVAEEENKKLTEDLCDYLDYIAPDLFGDGTAAEFICQEILRHIATKTQ